MRTLLGLGATVALLGAATVVAEVGWPARLPLHLALFVAAGLAWATALALLPRIARPPSASASLRSGLTRAEWLLVVGVAIALRLPAWLAEPAHSDDVYRYAWDGRVAHAGINPYRYPPADPALAPLRDGELVAQPQQLERTPSRPMARSGPLWRRVSNPDLPTIYPPAAQLVFALAASLPLGGVAALKLLLALFDLGVVVLLARLLVARGDDPRWAIAWAWSPLVAVEIGQSAHVDAVAVCALVAALWAWQSGRRSLAGALLGLATAVKLVTAPLAVGFRSARAWLAAALAVALVTLPFLSAGLAMRGSTGEFARRWRSNDGAYALVQAGFDRMVCRMIHSPPVARPDGGPQCEQALDLRPNLALASVFTGRAHRGHVYPDELSSFCARAACALVIALVTLLALVRRASPVAAAEWILGALLLFTPALHPWYALWMLPLVALRRRRAWVALAVLVPLGYAPLGAWLVGGAWRDPVWTRALEHGACWALLGVDGVRAWRARRDLAAARRAE